MRYLIIIALCMIFVYAKAQSPDNIFYLHIGDTTCRFALVQAWDTVQKEVKAPAPGTYERTVIDPVHVKAIRQLVKDTVIREITFVLLDTVARRAMAIANQETAAVVPVPVIPMNGHYTRPKLDDLNYAVKAEMTYEHFMDMLNGGIDIRSKDKVYPISIDAVSYKCGGEEGYTGPFENFRAKLKCLKNGGVALITIRSRDDNVYIHHPYAGLARITITK